MKKVRLTQVRSVINRPQSQRDTLVALGLKKINATSERELNPQVEGMVRKVAHLIKIEEI
ncbi:MAG: 50S ribosomal protein L30 [Schleiferiaceae bacterium]|jgi:large subunit ribosomal protein L30|nr:50S ribosomal protein L30 [Schleiferiaceae bacterium]